MNEMDDDIARDPVRAHDERRDFALARRLPAVAALAAVIGGVSAGAAWVLLHLIRVFTNLFFFQTLSDRPVSPAANTLGLAVIAVPAIGGLIIGLMARYGSEKIRGHGIPEAIEAILFNKSRMSPKVALLKPISSGIAIGSGGPFGAEGPIIMTGGALGSLRRGRRRRHDRSIRHAAGGDSACGRAVAVRVEAAELHSRCRRRRRRGDMAALSDRQRPAFPL